ncbi:biotin/lipoyl-binding protein [Leptolyngbya sp. AN02str]|uniref:biotin/lipoyl-binding protein n=1 Tax=Leptolyngbya sp. AN02str TaxID=3423363 RepID=UPI003D315828
MSAHLPTGATTGVSPFQVVPPGQIKPRPAGPSPAAVPPAPEPPANETEPSDRALSEDTSAPSRGHRRWAIVAIACASLGVVSLIPTPYEVGGTVQLTWKQSARQSVHTPVPAMVSEILVETGDVVQPGQVLAQLNSPQLNREIAELEEKLARSRQEREAAQREVVRANATVLEAAARAEAAEARSQNRLSQLEQGVLTPEVQALVVERDRLEGQIEEVAVQVQRYEALHQQGAVSLPPWRVIKSNSGIWSGI